MQKNPITSSNALELRRQAEETLQEKTALSKENLGELPPEEIQRILHELRVHQIELETQNDELRQAQEKLVASQARYFDLYDLAPVGYCTVSETGLILEINLTAATLLGVTRGILIKKRISQFIHQEDQDIFYRHRKQLLESGAQQSFDLRMIKNDGSHFWAHLESTTTQDENSVSPDYHGADDRRKSIRAVIHIVLNDISNRKQAEEAMKQLNERFKLLGEAARDAMWEWDLETNIVWSNLTHQELFGLTLADPVPDDKEWKRRMHPEELEQTYQSLQEARASTRNFWVAEYRLNTENKGWISILARTYIERNKEGNAVRMIGSMMDITERKRAEEKLVQSHDLLTNLARLVPGVVYQYRLYPDGRSAFPYSSPGMNDIYEVTPEEVREDATPVFGRLHPDDYNRVAESIQESARTLDTFYCEFRVILPRQGLRWRWSQAQPERTDDGGTLWYGIISDITERKQAEEALMEREYLLSASQRAAHVGTWNWKVDDTTVYWSDETFRIYGLNPDMGQPSFEFFFEIIHPDDRLKMQEWPTAVIAGLKPPPIEFRVMRPDGIYRVILTDGDVIETVDGVPSRIAGTAYDITERKQTEEKIRRQIDYLTALQDIDRAIAADFEMHPSLNTLISKAVSLLKVDAAAVMLVNSSMNSLEFATGNGFRTDAIEKAKLNIGEGYASRVVQEHRIVKIPDLKNEADNPFLTDFLKEEGFASYYGAPLIVKGKVIGVLEVFHRSLIKRDQEWLDFLNALAGQAAVAISNAQLFEHLQQSNIDLLQAYDATIEGWSRAMDLRDHETEGHTQRVTDLTLMLARAMRVSESQLTDIRRGALLHDIGKIGVPDSILLKEGKLTDEEWVLMRKHPQLAREMLMPIAYLKDSLDVPYCHHEKWDGTGYPQGLKEDHIPLAARIFAIVDVWDALTSDRVYRKKWTRQKTLAYIKEQNRKHFDPQVVEVFFEMMGKA